MISIDNLLTRLHQSLPDDAIPYKDRKFIQNMAEIIHSGFVTEGQSKVIMRLFQEHYDILINYEYAFESAMKNPRWSQEFRAVENLKRIYIFQKPETTKKVIRIEFTYLYDYKSIIVTLMSLTDLAHIRIGNLYELELTEYNIKLLHDTFTTKHFSFCDEFLKYLSIIKSWNKDRYANTFTFENVKDKPYIIEMLEEIGDDPNRDLIIYDRRIKYQYTMPNNHHGTDLASIIASRETHRKWIDNTKYSIDDLIIALHKLKRTKILFTFDSRNTSLVEKDLLTVANALDNSGITDNIGIYFRLSNNASKNFNTMIAEKKYNAKLTIDSVIVGIDYNKPPKFLLTSEWKPDAIIALNTNVISGKTAVYSFRCDLSIIYTNDEPIIRQRFI
jgi:hypothetical protein